MKRILTTTAFLIVIVAIAAAAVYALNGASVAETAAAPAAVTGSASVESDVLAPAAAENWNVISVPLDANQQFVDAGYLFDADGLIDLASPGATQVLHWDSASQTYEFRFSDGFGTNFPLEVGGVYVLALDSSASNVLSFVGDVPDQGSIQYSLVGGSTCQWNDIMLPLDKSDITLASELLTNIGDVDQVLSWDAGTQTYQFYFSDGFGTDFDTKIGYPYHVCVTVAKTWPQ